MSDSNKIRDAADAVKGIVEAVPVYQDVVQPAAKEVGTALQTVAKTIHVALAPVSALVWGYDKIKDYLNEALAERLKNIPQERIVSPNPAVAGPAVEALRFCAQEPNLRELYANLLATSMDSKTAEEAHPAFVEILRQLTPDEAHFLGYLFQHRPSIFPLISGRVYILFHDPQYKYEMDYKYDVRHFSIFDKTSDCKYPDLIPSYLDNLCRLGITEILLAESAQQTTIAPGFSYERVEKECRRSKRRQYAKFFNGQGMEPPKIRSIKLYDTKEVLRLTALGGQFCKSCVVQPKRI